MIMLSLCGYFQVMDEFVALINEQTASRDDIQTRTDNLFLEIAKLGGVSKVS